MALRTSDSPVPAAWASIPPENTKWATEVRLRSALVGYWILSGKTSGRYQDGLGSALAAAEMAEGTLRMMGEEAGKEGETFDSLVETEIGRSPFQDVHEARNKHLALIWLRAAAESGDLDHATAATIRESAKLEAGGIRPKPTNVKVGALIGRVIGQALEIYVQGIVNGLHADHGDRTLCIWSGHFESDRHLHDLVVGSCRVASVEGLNGAVLPPTARLLRSLGRNERSRHVEVLDARHDDEEIVHAFLALLADEGPRRRRERDPWLAECLTKARKA